MSHEPEKLPDWDTYYMGIAFAVREKANCTGNRVGAVIVKENRVIATGYNGVPAGITNCLDGGCLRCSNPGGQFKSGTGYDLCICVHAEHNALLSAAHFGIAVEGATLYTTMQPCFGCAKEIAQATMPTLDLYQEDGGRWPLLAAEARRSESRRSNKLNYRPYALLELDETPTRIQGWLTHLGWL